MTEAKCFVTTKFKVQGKEGLRQLLAQIEYQGTEDIGKHGLTQAGAYGDIRPAIDLLELAHEFFSEVLILRSEAPDLHGRFCAVIDKLNSTRTELQGNLNKHVKKGVL